MQHIIVHHQSSNRMPVLTGTFFQTPKIATWMAEAAAMPQVANVPGYVNTLAVNLCHYESCPDWLFCVSIMSVV
jgi:hypothetical protein